MEKWLIHTIHPKVWWLRSCLMLRRTIALIEAVRKCLGVCRQITAHNKIYVSGPILVKLAYAFNVNIYDYDWLSPNLVEKKQLQIEHMD